MGSADWGTVNEEDAFSILQQFVDAGGNFIDTADVYGMGISETIIGKFLKDADNKIHVATKLVRRGDTVGGWLKNFTYDVMKKQMEDSLGTPAIQQAVC